MNPERQDECGQSIVESILLIPAILALLAGAYWSYRQLSYSGSADSAAMAHMIRSGRNLPGMDDRLARTILPMDNGISFRAVDGPLIGQLPLFRGMTGRTKASVGVRAPAEPVGGFLDLPPHEVRRESEASVDCWDSESSSGNTARRTIRGILISGAFR
ncbi:MAG: hypothetical protein HZB86_08115 [Deltaproteobacteria bacterium]|nr:hypothetical protein [Deltaproteobacteria bacterium]